MTFRQKWSWCSLGLLIVALVLAGCGPGGASGQEPNFSADGRYVSVHTVKAEMDQGADFILLDARPAVDYEKDHITGAVNIPFDEVEQRYDELPKDKWIVAYCACPHAEADFAVDVLQEKGFTKLKVIDEGYWAWQDHGYPVTVG